MNSGNLKANIFTGTAIYISDDYIDVARVIYAMHDVHIPCVKRFRLSHSIKNLSFVEARNEIDSVLNKAFMDEEIKPKYRIAVNLRGQEFILRRFKIREIPESELDKAVLFEAQKYMPYSVDNLIFRFKKGTKNEGLQVIIFGGSEKENISAFQSYFREKKMLSSVVEPTPVLLSRIASLEYGIDSDKAYIVVHYEPRAKVLITGMWHKQPYFFKEITVDSGENQNGNKEGFDYPSIKDVWGPIGHEILASAEYMRKETDRDVEKIFISGFSKMPNEESVISKNFGIVFEHLSFPRFKSLTESQKRMFAPIFSLGFDMFNSSALNLAPEEVTYKDPWTFKPVIIKSGIAFFFILFLYIALSGLTGWQKKEMDRLKEGFDIYEIIRPEATREETIRFKETMQKKLLFIDKILAKRIYLADKLYRLALDMPPNAWINVIDFKNPTEEKKENFLRIKCELFSSMLEGNIDVNAILGKLEDDRELMEGFSNIKLIYARKREPVQGKEITEFEILFN